LSYLFAAIYFFNGFEIALGTHIVIIFFLTSSMIFYAPKRKKSKAMIEFIYSILCCSGFVGLKLLDLQLGSMHKIFTVVSGHFMSKVFDIGQIYFMLRFFEVFCIEEKEE